MNKQTKAAVAAGAGAILLLGGAGSLAYWNDEGTSPGGEINSGQLSLDDCTGGGGWTDVKNNTAIADINAFRIVPGDVVSYNCSTAVNATGDNLTATLSVDLGAVTGDAALKAALNPSVAATANGVALPSGPTGVQINPTDGKQPVVITVTMAFDAATSTTAAQNATINLGATALTLVQNTN
ncbi:alternate-type signal peptide domain-containing protein [Williamsia sp. D3]|uniref:alternate-type signal peptide domain-containing protein n=1 Tax=Williamsia sp. D3 TaxID=1313067 RepID=UPI000418709B|nr:alternate-type signal peptide domain-containing protein [Williamsia sp. D3]